MKLSIFIYFLKSFLLIVTALEERLLINDGTLYSEIQEIQANIVELKNKVASLESKSCMYNKNYNTRVS